MKRLLARVLLFSLVIMAPSFVNAEVEYEDLRTPEERGEGDFYGYDFGYCHALFCSARKTKLNAIEYAKEDGRAFCQKLGAVGVEFSNAEAKRFSRSSSPYKFMGSVHAKCVFK